MYLFELFCNMTLEELDIYNLSMNLSDKVWTIFIKLQYFEKQTVGIQLVKACDSISANISEGWGRNAFKENRAFLYIARGSLCESKTWLTKLKNRNLITNECFDELLSELNILGMKLNKYISYINNQIK